MIMARIFLVLLGAALLAAPARAEPARATVNAVVRATVLKPLLLEGLGDLDLGTIILSPGAWSSATVSISRAGVRSCPGGTVDCAGAATAARYRVTGTNRQTVTISAPPVVLTNGTDGSRLTMTLDAPATAALPNSGNQGVTFGVGGSITVTPATPGGVYSGTIEVTVDYQ